MIVGFARDVISLAWEAVATGCRKRSGGLDLRFLCSFFCLSDGLPELVDCGD